MTKRILITGATSGIGLELGRRMAAGNELLLTGRAAYRAVQDQLPANCTYQEADQTVPQHACENISAAIRRLGWDNLDIVVLNAAIGRACDPSDEPAASIRNILDVNINSVMLLAHRLHPLLEKVCGKLVLVGSVAHKGAPVIASYAASKAALNGFGRALAEEWRGKVTVKVIHPGPTASGMHAKADYDPGRAERFFLSTASTVRMIQRIMEGNKVVSNASYARFLLGGYWAGS